MYFFCILFFHPSSPPPWFCGFMSGFLKLILYISWQHVAFLWLPSFLPLPRVLLVMAAAGKVRLFPVGGEGQPLLWAVTGRAALSAPLLEGIALSEGESRDRYSVGLSPLQLLL